MPDAPTAVVISCEHGGNHVPEEFQAIFSPHSALLKTHRGHDAGALEMARLFAEKTQAALFTADVTRLLVDLNRSPGNAGLFSEITRDLPQETRARILENFYRPYREQVSHAIADRIDQGFRVLHVSSHSFTPVLNGAVRETEIGLLYDPSRTPEREFCNAWKSELVRAMPTMRVRRNYPYRGTSDGFTAFLRKRHSGEHYVGLEVEINQKLVGDAGWETFKNTLAESLARMCH